MQVPEGAADSFLWLLRGVTGCLLGPSSIGQPRAGNGLGSFWKGAGVERGSVWGIAGGCSTSLLPSAGAAAGSPKPCAPVALPTRCKEMSEQRAAAAEPSCRGLGQQGEEEEEEEREERTSLPKNTALHHGGEGELITLAEAFSVHSLLLLRLYNSIIF